MTLDGPGSDDGGRADAARRGMLLAWWAACQPQRAALISNSGERSFGELNARANRLARALRRQGLERGDAVALLCTNRCEFAEVVHACQRSGLRLTPINWHLTGDEAAYIVGNCQARAVIAEGALGAVARGAVAPGAAADPGGASCLLAIGGDLEGFSSYERALDAEDDADLDDPVLGSTMLYTSGTTGRPKGVHRDTAATTALAQVNLYGYVEGGDDIHLCTGPLYHAAPLAFSLAAPLAFGVGVVLMDHWDPEEALRLIHAHRVTHSHMVPTMFHRLLALPADVRCGYDVSSLRFVIHGAAPCPVPVKRRLIEWLGPVVVEYYAATEGLGTFVDSATWLAKPGTVGRALVDGAVMVADENGSPLGPDEEGLVFLRATGATRFAYFGDEEKTTAAFRGEYFTLGDVGYLDTDGYLFLTDRSANLIISGGVNIYPAELDAVLLEHDAVADVAVIGVPSDEWGEEVKAVVELRRGVAPSDALAAELLAMCRARLAHYKCPRSVDFVGSLPREDTGKIYKRLLRERYREQARSG